MASCCFRREKIFGGCDHAIVTIVRTIYCPEAGPDHPNSSSGLILEPGLCAHCEDSHISTPAETSIDECHEEDANEEMINYREGLEKCEEKNEELMKIIADLTLTRPIQKILVAAQEKISDSLFLYSTSVYLGLSLPIQPAASRGGELTTATMATAERDIIEMQDTIEAHLEKAKADIMKECGEGIKHLLDAVKKGSS